MLLFVLFNRAQKVGWRSLNSWRYSKPELFWVQGQVKKIEKFSEQMRGMLERVGFSLLYLTRD